MQKVERILANMFPTRQKLFIHAWYEFALSRTGISDLDGSAFEPYLAAGLVNYNITENPPAAWAALDPNFRRGDDAFLHHSCEKRESSFSVQLIEREIELEDIDPLLAENAEKAVLGHVGDQGLDLILRQV